MRGTPCLDSAYNRRYLPNRINERCNEPAMRDAIGRNRRKSVSGARLPDPRANGNAPSTKLQSGDLMRYYEAMSGALGPMRWWPAKTPFEVIVGAILTQSTAWGNVERAMDNLRAANMLTPSAILKARTVSPGRPGAAVGLFPSKSEKIEILRSIPENRVWRVAQANVPDADP